MDVNSQGFLWMDLWQIKRCRGCGVVVSDLRKKWCSIKCCHKFYRKKKTEQERRRRVVEKDADPDRKCRECGLRIPSESSARSFCSSRCSGEWHDRSKATKKKIKRWGPSGARQYVEYPKCVICVAQLKEHRKACSVACGYLYRWGMTKEEHGDKAKSKAKDKERTRRESRITQCQKSLSSLLRQVDAMLRPCDRCGEPIGIGRTKYCSDACQGGIRKELRRQRERDAGPFDRDSILEEEGYVCCMCGVTVVSGGNSMDSLEDNYATIDHVIPLSKGGTSDRGNLRCCCRRCNIGKGNKMGKLGNDA